jgi:signal peptidase II
MMKALRALPAPQLGWLIVAVTFGLDQISKNVVLYGFGFIDRAGHNAVEILPFFNLVMVWNEGVSFGMFEARSLVGVILLSVFSLGVAGVLGVWLMRASNRLLALGLGMVIGGALGNVVDRAIYGAVADFFDFHVMGYHWYIFNIADVGIVIGVAVLVLDSFLQPQDVDRLGDRPSDGVRTGELAGKPKGSRENPQKSVGTKQ